MKQPVVTCISFWTLQFSQVLFAETDNFTALPISWGKVLSRMHAVKKRARNGEVHFILPESVSAEACFDEAEIRKVSKRDASKPLLLLRAE